MLGLLVHKSVMGAMVREADFLGALGLFGSPTEEQDSETVVRLEAKTAGETSASYVQYLAHLCIHA